MTGRSLKPIDSVIADNLRIQRKKRRLTQKEAAKHLGISFQQYQKYENAKNRIASSMLYDISRLFDVPVESFFANQAYSQK